MNIYILLQKFFCFKKNILYEYKKAAINFHPGIPDYRGTGCINYALCDEANIMDQPSI